MASNPGNDPGSQPIERMPFETIEKAYDRWVIDKWMAWTLTLVVVGGVIVLMLAFSGDGITFGIPELLYAVGTLMVATGISVVVLDALSQGARMMIRDMALYGTREPAQPPQPPTHPSFDVSGKPGAPSAQGGSIAFTQIMDAAKNLPTPRFLIIFGIVAMLLGAGLDGKWTMPTISFEVGTDAATPAAEVEPPADTPVGGSG